MSDSNNKSVLPWLSLGGVLALGFIIAALILAHSATQIASSRESITVKGTAEKAVKADKAIWSATVTVQAGTIAEALPQLQEKIQLVKSKLTEAQLIDASRLQQYDWTSTPVYERTENGSEGRLIGYQVSQQVGIVLNDVSIPAKLDERINQLIMQNIPVERNNTQYMVSNIESIKLSLIASATKNAHDRALEFAKSGDVNVGNMRSASQGVFQIQAPLSTGSDDEYGGEYDTSTIDKVARVVVTVNYAIQ